MIQHVFMPAELKLLCQRYRLSPSKQYGQHYLISLASIKKMIAAAELSPDDTVVEIGPGFGVLTLAVAPLVKKVIAFEIEKKLQPYWEEKQLEFSNVEIIWGNALRQLTMNNEQLTIPYKIVANLPYQITSEALRVILELNPPPERVIVMVQKEVAERICAKPGAMSLLSVAVQYYGEPRIITKVSKGNFWPVPKVDSAVISIDLTPDPSPLGEGRGEVTKEDFFRIVKAGFSNPRKQLWGNVAQGLHLPPDMVQLAVIHVTGNQKVRAEELSIDAWRQLVQAIYPHVEKSA